VDLHTSHTLVLSAKLDYRSLLQYHRRIINSSSLFLLQVDYSTTQKDSFRDSNPARDWSSANKTITKAEASLLLTII